MVLLVAVLSMIVIAQAVVLYRLLRELRNAHVNLAAEVGVVRRESVDRDRAINNYISEFRASVGNDGKAIVAITYNHDLLRGRVDESDAYAKSLNERLVLLEIEKPHKPKEAEEPAPSRRSFASQKARAEAGARKT